MQPVPHADPDQRQIIAQQLRLLRHRALRGTARRQRCAQIGDEMLEHQRRLLWRGLDQADHVGQGVEQEVRFDLGLQQAHAGFDQLLLRRQRAHLFLRHVLRDLALFPLPPEQADATPRQHAVYRQADAPAHERPTRPRPMRRSHQMEADQQCIDRHVDHGVHIEETQRAHAAAGVFKGALLGGGSPDAGVWGVHVRVAGGGDSGRLPLRSGL
ncbi:hypothetical protein D3C72_1623060 [compost metagenome]